MVAAPGDSLASPHSPTQKNEIPEVPDLPVATGSVFASHVKSRSPVKKSSTRKTRSAPPSLRSLSSFCLRLGYCHTPSTLCISSHLSRCLLPILLHSPSITTPGGRIIFSPESRHPPLLTGPSLSLFTHNGSLERSLPMGRIERFRWCFLHGCMFNNEDRLVDSVSTE